MIDRRTAMLIAAALLCGGILLAVAAVATIPLGLGGPGFGYKKLLMLLIGLEAAGCGILLWRRLSSSEGPSTAIHPTGGYPASPRSHAEREGGSPLK